MHTVHSTRARPQPFGFHPLQIPALRTYAEIAAVLTERERIPISAADVEHQCRRAEAKVAEALRTDPGSRPRWRCRAATPDRKGSHT
jgi:hypothetical protein